MKRLVIGTLILLIFVGWQYSIYSFQVPGKPARLQELEQELIIEQEKLISAQILNSNLDRVAKLINSNLANSLEDSLAEDASVPFMNEVIDLTQRLGINLKGLEAAKRKREQSFIRTPYHLSINTTYAKFSQLVTILEKSDRLVTIDGYRIVNEVNELIRARNMDDIQQHDFLVHLNTLTLIKSKSSI